MTEACRKRIDEGDVVTELADDGEVVTEACHGSCHVPNAAAQTRILNWRHASAVVCPKRTEQSREMQNGHLAAAFRDSRPRSASGGSLRLAYDKHNRWPGIIPLYFAVRSILLAL